MIEQASQPVLGIDLGGTKILTAVINRNGKILSRDLSPTLADQGVSAVIRAIVKSAENTLSQAGIKRAGLAAVGIGAAGLSNPESGILFTSPHLPGWKDVPLKDLIARETGRPAFLINDAKAAALGELNYGTARNSRNFIYITISTGIGGGIIIDGKIYTGAIGTAGEVGHMTIQADGPLCECGNHGCWEALASGWALAREAVKSVKKGLNTTILDYAGGDVKKITAVTVQRAAENGDRLAEELIARTAYYVGVGLANLVNIFNPELIVIGGGLTNIGDKLLQPAYKIAGERAFKTSFEAVRFARAELGGDSGVLGAAAFAFSKIKIDTDSLVK